MEIIDTSVSLKCLLTLHVLLLLFLEQQQRLILIDKLVSQKLQLRYNLFFQVTWKKKSNIMGGYCDICKKKKTLLLLHPVFFTQQILELLCFLPSDILYESKI